MWLSAFWIIRSSIAKGKASCPGFRERQKENALPQFEGERQKEKRSVPAGGREAKEKDFVPV